MGVALSVSSALSTHLRMLVLSIKSYAYYKPYNAPETDEFVSNDE